MSLRSNGEEVVKEEPEKQVTEGLGWLLDVNLTVKEPLTLVA